MAKVAPKQTSFSTGEISPLAWADVDNPRRAAALALCQNYIPLLQGALTRRPGNKYVNEVKDSSSKSRLIRFKFSNTQAYALEFSASGTIRIYQEHALLLDSSDDAVEVTSPYTSDLNLIRTAQSGDVLYLVHPDHPVKKLSRTSATTWTLTDVDFIDGPYLDSNVVDTSNYISAITTATVGGSPGYSLTFSAATGINGGDGFTDDDIGRLIRIQQSSTSWTVVKVYSVTSTTEIDVTDEAPAGASGLSAGSTGEQSSDFRLGLYSDVTGYPSAIAFHESRLFLAGVKSYPLRVDGSRSQDFENFRPSSYGGDDAIVVADSDGMAFTIASQEVSGIKWLESDSEGLLIGGSDNEWIVKPATTTAALSGTNISVKPATYCGSGDVAPIRTTKTTVFIQNNSRNMNEFKYYYSDDGFLATDLSILAEHLTANGIEEIVYQKSPFPIIWARTSKGQLIGVTYLRGTEALRVGWHPHILGGVSDEEGNPPVVESICDVPSPDGSRTEIWMVVKRYINGSTVRYIEYMTPFFDETMTQKEAFFLDSALTYDDPKTISGVSKANPAVVTCTAHGFSTGDKVLIEGVFGMTKMNDVSGLITKIDDDSFSVPVDSTNYNTYVSGGTARKYVSTITGLDHLEGETVDVWADGAVQASKVVSSGDVTLESQAAGPVTIGYGYKSKGKLLAFNSGAADGTALGKTRRTHRCGVYFYRSLGLKIGTDFDDLKSINFRKRSDPLGKAPELFTGIKSETFEAPYDFENDVCFMQDQPGPSTILAVLPQMVTQDR